MQQSAAFLFLSFSVSLSLSASLPLSRYFPFCSTQTYILYMCDTHICAQGAILRNRFSYSLSLQYGNFLLFIFWNLSSVITKGKSPLETLWVFWPLIHIAWNEHAALFTEERKCPAFSRACLIHPTDGSSNSYCHSQENKTTIRQDLYNT